MSISWLLSSKWELGEITHRIHVIHLIHLQQFVSRFTDANSILNLIFFLHFIQYDASHNINEFMLLITLYSIRITANNVLLDQQVNPYLSGCTVTIIS